jgi:hypothetical protein
MAPSGEVLRYLDQVVDCYDPEIGLTLPEQIAWLVSVAQLPPGDWADEPEATWLRLFAALLRERGAPRVRALILHDCSEYTVDGCDIPFEDCDPLPLLRRHAGRLAGLERLHVGVFPAELPPTSGFCQGVGPALAGLPALQWLHLVGERGWELLPPGGHPGLRTLLMHVTEPDDDPLAVLVEARFPALERLDLWLGPAVVDGRDEGALGAALASERFAGLRELALRGLESGELLAELAQQRDLGGVQALAVTHGPVLADEALAELLAAPWLARLARLDLRGTGASAALAAELAARGPEVVRER